MATALTVDQKITLCEVLEIPYSTSFYSMDGMGTIANVQNVSEYSSGQAKTQLLIWLDTLDAGTETRLIAYLTRWNVIGTATTNMQGGSVGDVSGVSLDYEKEREIIKNRVQKTVPFLVWKDIEARQSGKPSAGVASGSGSVPMIR